MDSIIIGFSKPKKFKLFAWLIMKGYNIPYDHVYIKFHSNSIDRDLIYQASGLVVNFANISTFESINDVVKEFQFDISSDNKTSMIRFAVDNVGKPYGFKDILGLAWARINELLGRKISNPVNDGQNAWVCCELGAYILENFAGVEVPENINNITPRDLYDYLVKLKS